MALSSIALCSRALLKLGAMGIASFDEGTAEAEVADNLYPSTRDALLCSHPWSFATEQMTLTRLKAELASDFSYAYQLPPDFLRALWADQAGRGVEYRIAERRLHTNADDVALSYIFRPDEAEWPPYFDQVLIARLAAEFCLPLTESTSRGEALAKLADRELARARTVDNQLSDNTETEKSCCGKCLDKDGSESRLCPSSDKGDDPTELKNSVLGWLNHAEEIHVFREEDGGDCAARLREILEN